MTTRLKLIGAAGLAIAGGAAIVWLRSGLMFAPTTYSEPPRLLHRDSERMLVVEAVGDPNVVAGDAFKLLFATYYKIPGISRMSRPPAPRARWPHPEDTPRAEWVGRYGLPIAATVTVIPPVTGDRDLPMRLETWEYGEVAESLHLGPYSEESADIGRLRAFVTASGCQVIGDHEEEYVRGPGMVFRGDPRKYLTIVRLRVAPIEGPSLDEENDRSEFEDRCGS